MSIYAFILMLSSEKKYIYSIEGLFFHLHMAKYISEKILKVVNAVCLKIILFIVLNNASTIVKVKQIVNNEYKHIIPIHCIVHHINLLTTDIMKHKYSKEI